MGNLIVLCLFSLFCIPKAALEAAYFRDRSAAKETISVWMLGAGCLATAFCLSLFLDYGG